MLVRARRRAVRHKKSATAGNYSVFKAYHVERNRLYCLWKWMPRFLVFVSPLFTLNRYAMQGYAAHTHQGLSAEFVKEYSLARLFVLLIQAWIAALCRLPRMLASGNGFGRRARSASGNGTA